MLGRSGRFADRVQAGDRLADRLTHLAAKDPVVLGLPRGGVIVADRVADALHAPLDVVLVRKLGVPFQPELAMGAIGEDGVRVLEDGVVASAGLRPDDIERVESRERLELERRSRRYRAVRPALSLTGRTALIVDDGIATGATVRAACQVVRALGAAEVVVATPVAPPDVIPRLETVADLVICLATPIPFYAIGAFYQDFSATTDDEVVAVLKKSAAQH
ncbi:MAG: phosphoribosyltransferase [Actinomycetota bacterium]